MKKKFDLFKCPRNEEELKEYIWNVWKLRIPDSIVVEGHSSPFQFFADLFFERVSNAMGIGNRGSGKTFLMALLYVLNSIFKKGCESGHAGAIERQAFRCYEHFRRFKKPFEPYGCIINSKQKETVFTTPAKVEILTATITGMNGPHMQKCTLDEAEEVLWKVYQEFLNMCQTNPLYPDIKAQNVLISTRKSAHGTIEKILQQKDDKGWKIYIWSLWETTERCRLPSCSQCENMIKGEMADGSPRTFAKVCDKKLKKSNGFIKLEDTWNRFKTLDSFTWKAQQECEKPSREGTVFYWFDKDMYVWDFDTDTKEGLFYEGLDWGGSAPHAWVLWQEVGGIWQQIDEIVIPRVSVTKLAEMVLEKRRYYDLTEGRSKCLYYDPENTVAALEFDEYFNRLTAKTGEYFAPMIAVNKFKGSIQAGITIMNSMGESKRIRIHQRCEKSIIEWSGYSYCEGTINNDSRNPIGKDDHTIDASRYIFLEENPALINIEDIIQKQIKSKEDDLEPYKLSSANVFDDTFNDICSVDNLFSSIW